MLALMWRDAEAQEHKIADNKLRWSCMSIALNEPKHSYLMMHGLDIQDNKGGSLGTSKVCSDTLPIYNLVNSFVQSPVQEELSRVWESQSVITVNKALFQNPNVSSTPAIGPFQSPPVLFRKEEPCLSRPTTMQAGSLPRTSSSRKLRRFSHSSQVLPLGSSISPLRESTRGGEVDPASPESFPDAHSVWTAFAASPYHAL